MNGVFLSIETLNKLNSDIRSAVLEAAGITPVGAGTPDQRRRDDEYLVRFNERQLRQLLKKPLHATSRKILEAVADVGPRFRVGDVLDKLGMQYAELRGALSGLTRRTRKIANDGEIELFAIVQAADDVRDQLSEIHPDTHAALRRVFNAGD